MLVWCTCYLCSSNNNSATNNNFYQNSVEFNLNLEEFLQAYQDYENNLENYSNFNNNLEVDKFENEFELEDSSGHENELLRKQKKFDDDDELMNSLESKNEVENNDELKNSLESKNEFENNVELENKCGNEFEDNDKSENSLISRNEFENYDELENSLEDGNKYMSRLEYEDSNNESESDSNNSTITDTSNMDIKDLKELKDLNSFLFLTTAKLQRLDEEVVFPSVQHEDTFTLHGCVLSLSSDTPALTKLICLIGHNSYRGCCYCNIKGIYSSHIYYPTKPSSDQNSKTYDPENLLIRTHNEFKRQIKKIQKAQTQLEKNQTIKHYSRQDFYFPSTSHKLIQAELKKINKHFSTISDVSGLQLMSFSQTGTKYDSTDVKTFSQLGLYALINSSAIDYCVDLIKIDKLFYIVDKEVDDDK
ncbi:13471_t:CDS:2 [Cetraspora pellucida]|uniref:13471_t:CDS:1 n=1 Tax=Cetraspora pellucida TaxID=1433469 RepID=A0A9N8WAI1_9GLOM|nr:13471_t:CDS:2 [Cetraspora pellucida]